MALTKEGWRRLEVGGGEWLHDAVPHHRSRQGNAAMEIDTVKFNWASCFQKTKGSNANVDLWVNPVLYRLVQARNGPENQESSCFIKED